MPFYRITIWIKDVNKPVQGIRQYQNQNISAVTNIARVKAQQHYGEQNIVDIEAAMLSSHSSAVKKYLKNLDDKTKPLK